MDIGPVELIVLQFPGESADPGVVRELADVVERGYVTILDLTFLTRTTDGLIRVVDVDESLDEFGFGSLEIGAQALVSEDDMGLVRDSLEPGTSAAVIVYEESWARELAGAVRAAGGEVGLHVQIPRETVEAAIVAATQ